MRPCAHAPTGPGRGEPCRRALGDQRPLELGEGREDAEGETAVGGCGVDLRSGPGQNLEADATKAEVLGRGDEMSKVAPETIELPQHQGVARLKGFQTGQQAGAGIMPAGGEILVDAFIGDASGEKRVALRSERLAAVALRDPDVADQHESPEAARKDTVQPAISRSFPQRVF